jgi:hypothetical protein
VFHAATRGGVGMVGANQREKVACVAAPANGVEAQFNTPELKQ